jgi:hypothetical protein
MSWLSSAIVEKFKNRSAEEAVDFVRKDITDGMCSITMS